jgi:hypothetical protein
MASSTDRVTPTVKMSRTIRGRWPVQLRLGVEGETEIPEVWVTLGAEDRAVVIERLAETMAKAAVAAAAGQGGESSSAGSESGEEVDSGVTRIA